jgi:hypothetical protein
VARLGANDPVPAWGERGAFTSITRTPFELSIVCAEEHVPAGVRAEDGWRCLALEGPIAFETIGVAAEITRILASRGVSVFVVSTFDTDYVLVKRIDEAIDALLTAGHEVRM